MLDQWTTYKICKDNINKNSDKKNYNLRQQKIMRFHSHFALAAAVHNRLKKWKNSAIQIVFHD